MPSLKPNSAEFRAALQRHKRPEVFHWTPATRLPSVLEHGILCRRELEARHIAYDPHGYGRSGKENDFVGHVCVSFYPQRGMMRGESGPPAVIVMTSAVVIIEGTFYCPENTAKAECEFDELVTHTSVEHLDELFEGPAEWKLRDWQAEVWIPNGLPVRVFSEVWFRNEAERDNAVAACAGLAATLPRTLRFMLARPWFRF